MYLEKVFQSLFRKSSAVYSGLPEVIKNYEMRPFVHRRESYTDCQGKVERGNGPKTYLNFVEWGLAGTAAM